ncbi:tyrosine-type recombinase/integrase [Desertivirga brevis]|uniref:tyrosine-type recombinase/integrase n=1 Tax=Desertivirga brevis TaxID=2810310 RepID=UPI001A977067|nr:tyrosine-type recombinase/integrase [Pedobacter sp. SYSU D00873]
MFLERFKSYLQYEKRFSEHTIAAYMNDLEQFQTFIQSQNPDMLLVGHQDVRSWMVDLMNNSIAPNTINRKLSTLRTFYTFLQREKLVELNPTLLIKALKAPKRLPVVVHESKMDDLLDSEGIFAEDFEGRRDKLIIELLFGTGIRLAELLNIKERDVNFFDHTLKILGKRSKERIAPVSPQIISEIKEYLSLRELQNFDNLPDQLFVTKDGKRAYPTLIYRIVKRYLDYITTNQKKSPHVLRHSFATSLLNNGADLNAIKELLGHASLAATQVYTHNSVEKLKSIYKQAHPRA